MHTFADLAKAVNRSTVYVSGLQSRFELPTFDGVGYPEAYLAFLQTVVHLRILSIAEETLRNLWHLEKKLLQLLHADSSGSSTWFLDSCGATTSPKRRLLLTNYDVGVEVHGRLRRATSLAFSLFIVSARANSGTWVMPKRWHPRLERRHACVTAAGLPN